MATMEVKEHAVTVTFVKTTANYHVYTSGKDPMFPPDQKHYFSKAEIGEVPPPTKELVVR